MKHKMDLVSGFKIRFKIRQDTEPRLGILGAWIQQEFCQQLQKNASTASGQNLENTTTKKPVNGGSSYTRWDFGFEYFFSVFLKFVCFALFWT